MTKNFFIGLFLLTVNVLLLPQNANSGSEGMVFVNAGDSKWGTLILRD